MQVLGRLLGQACHKDDIIVFRKDQTDNDVRLAAVLQRLRDEGITLKPRKSELGKTRVKFLGHILDKESITADSEMSERCHRPRT